MIIVVVEWLLCGGYRGCRAVIKRLSCIVRLSFIVRLSVTERDEVLVRFPWNRSRRGNACREGMLVLYLCSPAPCALRSHVLNRLWSFLVYGVSILLILFVIWVYSGFILVLF